MFVSAAGWIITSVCMIPALHVSIHHLRSCRIGPRSAATDAPPTAAWMIPPMWHRARNSARAYQPSLPDSDDMFAAVTVARKRGLSDERIRWTT